MPVTFTKADARAYLDQIPFRQARNYGGPDRGKPIRFVVIHSTEGSERLDSAEIALSMWATWDRQSSVHYAVDQNSTVCAVRPEDKAWHAKGGNSDTIGIEHCGRAAQTRDEWLDAYGRGMLAQSARLVAALLVTFDIPFRRATAVDHANANADTSSNGYPGGPWKGGILAHADISKSAALRGISTDGHWDPGPNFAWDHLFDQIADHLEDDTMTPAQFLALLDDKHVAARLGQIVDNQIVERIGQLDKGITPTVKNAVADALVENLKRELIKPKP